MKYLQLASNTTAIKKAITTYMAQIDVLISDNQDGSPRITGLLADIYTLAKFLPSREDFIVVASDYDIDAVEAARRAQIDQQDSRYERVKPMSMPEEEWYGLTAEE